MIKQLDDKLKPFITAGSTFVPEKGWINTIRTTLNMTLDQLGRRLNITRQAVKKIENSEVRGSISLNSLRKTAAAMDMKLIYAVIPREESIDKYIEKKATALAKKIVLRTHQNMLLEDQGISDDKIVESINDLAAELKRELRKSLWD